MTNFDYLEPDLNNCKLCEWRCGVDRLNGETGICGITIPKVASSKLHPAPPASFDAFLTGCNFKCLFCQNWLISMYDEDRNPKTKDIEGYYDPQIWAELGTTCLTLPEAEYIEADRLFFTGGEPTCSLPWIEAVVRTARQIIPDIKVNFDTNGFLTKDSLKRVLDFTTSITYDLKAFDPDVFHALTGASVKPVLRNLKYILKNDPDKLWEIRVMVIPGIHDYDVKHLCKFLADIKPSVKINFLVFRPNFVMEDYYGPSIKFMENCVDIAKKSGLKNVTWSGRPDIDGKLPGKVKKIMKDFDLPPHLALPMGFAHLYDCKQHPRNCGSCEKNKNCSIKKYIPERIC